MKTKTTLLIISFLLISGFLTSSFSQGAEELFQKGIQLEEGDGNLPEAIKVYRLTVADKNADRTIRANALYHIGLCYEKLGKGEAQKAYQQLVSDFADQGNVVALARERLKSLIQIAEKVSNAPLVPKFTKVKIPTKLSSSVNLSPDGKDLALVSDKKLWKMPVSGNLGSEFSGIPVQINTEGIDVSNIGLSWSGNGKWIAFNENIIEDIKDKGIYIVSSAGGKPNKIVETNRGNRIINYIISLSPDGEKLAFSSIEDKKQYVHSISADGSNLRQLTDMEAREPVYSPNEKMIAFVEDKNTGTGSGDLGLWVVPTHNGTPRLVANAEKACSPVWSPDSKKLAFFEYNNGKQINIVHDFSDGASPGKVTSIDVPEGIEEVLQLAGWTPDNKIGALLRTKVEFGLYTMPAKGGQPAIVLSEGNSVQPRWSPDSKKIYYINDNDVTSPTSKTLGVVSAEGGKGKLLPISKDVLLNFPYQYQAGNRISPDGKLIISAASSSKELVSNKPPSTQIWKIPIDGGKPIQITNPNPSYGDFAPSWSPDGNQIAFLRLPLNDFFGKGEDSCAIYMLNIDDRIPKLLLKEKLVLSPVWSPDGKMIAYLSSQDDDVSSISVVNVINGESHMISEIPSTSVHTDLAWSPDSKRIAFLDNKSKVVKVVSLSEGSIEDVKTNLVDVKIYHLDWSPDGERFVFGGVKEGDFEFWFLEDFLPFEKLGQKEESKNLLIRKALANTKIEPLGTVSPDGRYISFVDWWTNSNLSIIDLKTKERKCISDFKNEGEQAYYSIWSPDGKWLAFFWWEMGDKDFYNISVIDVTGNNSKKLFTSDKVSWIELGNWSADGKYILAALSLNDNQECQIVRISTEDGSLQILKTVEKPYLGGKPLFSPNGRYIAYEIPDDKASGNSDIYIYSMDDKQENALFKHPAHDYILGWTPDGNNILFASDRTGTVDAMIIPVNEGKTTGQPKTVKSNIGSIVPMGFTKDNKFYYGDWPGQRNVFSAEIDIENGKTIKKPTLLINRFEGRNGTPAYSNNGKYLAYISKRGIVNMGKSETVLCIKDMETGVEDVIFPPYEIAGSVSHPTWSPDDNKIALMCRKGGRQTISQFNIPERKFTPLVTEAVDQPFYTDNAYPQWSGDGKTLYYLQVSKDSDVSRILARNLDTGKDKELFRYQSEDMKDRIFNISISPDRKWLSAINGGEKRILNLISTDDGQLKHLFSFDCKGGESLPQVWSKDGKYILYPYVTKDRGWSLMRIPVDGGEKMKIELGVVGISSPSLHPDGRTLTFSSAGYSLPKNNIWVMENFLPKEQTVNK